jgi:hypothetical protein
MTNGSYFVVDQRTGGRRNFDTKIEFLDALNKSGISQVPELSSVETICKTQECKPCTTHTPSP